MASPARSVRFAAGTEDHHHHHRQPPPKSASQQHGLICPNCGSRDIDQPDVASGASVCTECGVVVEESGIVSSVEFVEGAGGSSSMVGQFVSATSSKAYTGGGAGRGGAGRGGRFGFSRESREATLANGRRKIQEVASRLRLGMQFVDAAHRFYAIAVEKNFVAGRRTMQVISTCLYIACRQEKTQHMLIDFSDAVQVNVYSLGICFLKFRRLLGLKLEVIDPALYIYRFCAHMDLDDKANAVGLTALRLVARMKRDWMVTGRKPAGICAAALLIAARAHGFGTHHSNVTRILRICGVTVRKRVKEFENTPTAQLTLDQFHQVDLVREQDPPIFTTNKVHEARVVAIRNEDHELVASGALDHPLHKGKHAKKWRTAKKVPPQDSKDAQLNEFYTKLDAELSTQTETEQEPEKQQLVVRGTEQQIEGFWKDAYPTKQGKPVVLPDDSTPEERQPSTAIVEGQISTTDWKESMPASIDEEVESFFRTEEEEKAKELVFNKLHKDYIETQKRKRAERKSAKQQDGQGDLDAAAQAESQARYRRKRAAAAGSDEYATTEQQLLAAVNSRKVSRKINYDALSSIFDEDGAFDNGTTDDVEAAAEPVVAAV